MPQTSISAHSEKLCSIPPQGALDGGLDIPHNEKRFVGYDASSKEYDAEIMKKYIFGGHVGEYMEEMAEEEPEKYQAHFAKYLEEGLDDCDALEEMYSEVTRSRGDISVTGDQQLARQMSADAAVQQEDRCYVAAHRQQLTDSKHAVEHAHSAVAAMSGLIMPMRHAAV